MIHTPESVEALRELGVIGALDLHFARTLARLADERDGRVLLAAAMASRHVQNGHVCLDLTRLSAAPMSVESAEGPVSVRFPDALVWRAALAKSPLCGGGGGGGRAGETGATDDGNRPLYLDDHGRLYLRRYLDYERELAAAIWSRVPRPPPSAMASDPRDSDAVDERRLQQGLDRLFPPPAPASSSSRAARKRADDPAQLDLFAALAAPALASVTGDPGSAPAPEQDLQRLAARQAVRRPFAVISGGPGTGKTSTVVKILALLIEQALGAERPAPRIALLAPTGKAAARLSESIKQAKARLACSEAVRAAIGEEASTIHRALGTFGGRVNRFRHHRDRPLPVDVVIVDEASMVDLALMAHLFDALPAAARVILLGDKNQLSSVEAGAVLGDICGAGLPADTHAPIAGAIVHLTRSYRYAPDSGIRALADAINAADADAALAVLEDPDVRDATLIEPPPGAPARARQGIPPALVTDALSGMRPLFEAKDPRSRLEALERFRVLCAHRRGPSGLVAANGAIEAALRQHGLITGDSERYDGRPVLVTQNDYQARLFNGDVGVLALEPDAQNGDRMVCRAHFVGAGGAPYALSATRLPPHESVYAMSVHKSQGSEFDRVAVLLPSEASPVLSRELLYTAVTRARQQVAIYGSRAMVRHAIETAVERASGLRDRLWGADQRTSARP